MDIEWDIRNEGRRWSHDEALDRYALTPEKLEMIYGKLLENDEERLVLLALLLENVGANSAVRLGDPAVWREAIARLEDHGAWPIWPTTRWPVIEQHTADILAAVVSLQLGEYRELGW